MNDLAPNTFIPATPQTVVTPRDRADHATGTAFLNALLREWDGWTVLDPKTVKTLDLVGDYACLPLAGRQDQILVRLKHQGRFRSAFEFPFLMPDGETALREVPLAEAIALLALDPAASGGDPSRQLKLLQRILDSRLAMERAYAQPDDCTQADHWTFQQAEQALMSGHPTHPNPRSRDEVNEEEARQFAPELRGQFPLFWVLADTSILAMKAAGTDTADEYARNLALSDPSLPQILKDEVPAGFTPVPWHPWQAARLLSDPQIARWVENGKLQIVGPVGSDFAATASMRGVHAWHAPYMLKFSLSMRLTNSERVLAAKEVERGIQMCRLLDSPVGTAIMTDEPRLTILREPAYIALKADDGSTIEKSFVVFRDNPFRGSGQSGPVMLASLCEERLEGLSPLGNLVAERAKSLSISTETAAAEWLERYLDVAIAPLMRIRARHGLLFGSHQQNMMISLTDGLPSRVWVRDCQGTGHLTTHHAELEKHVPDIGLYGENVAPPELGDNLLCYYVIVNNLMNVVSMLAIEGLLPEQQAYAQIRRHLEREMAECEDDTSFYVRLLSEPTLCSKGNYRTSLSGVNEAAGDAGGQLASFLEIPNPLSNPEFLS
ncbi:IucA/IucC family protein [Roseibium sp.]|uniref:IucA/IucC family protein n=1 Tax=Roseibium sp. TaxID=1936156 RepID=UPI003A97A5FF